MADDPGLHMTTWLRRELEAAGKVAKSPLNYEPPQHRARDLRAAGLERFEAGGGHAKATSRQPGAKYEPEIRREAQLIGRHHPPSSTGVGPSTFYGMTLVDRFGVSHKGLRNAQGWHAEGKPQGHRTGCDTPIDFTDPQWLIAGWDPPLHYFDVHDPDPVPGPVLTVRQQRDADNRERAKVP